TVSSTGDVTVFPATIVHAKTQVQGLALAAAQPYVAAQSVLAIKSGTVSLDGDVTVTPDESFAYDGKASVDDFAMVRADSGDRLADWKRLSGQGIAVRLSQSRAEIATAALDHAFLQLHFDKAGTLNLVHLMRGEEPTPVPEPPAEMAQDTPKPDA